MSKCGAETEVYSRAMKPYYQDSIVTIYHGDCREILPELKSGSIDMILTDPPYGHNNNNGDLISKWEQALGQKEKAATAEARPICNDGPQEMRQVVDAMLKEAVRILKHDCCCCCCCGGGGPKPTFAWLAERMDEQGLSFFHAVVWDKGGLGMGWRYRRNYEMIMVAHRRGGKLKWECQSSGMETANVVRLNKIIPSASEHPTPKPVELMRHFLRLHAKPGDLILDPFMGAGTTLVACKEMGIKAIGIEMDEKWCEMAVKRLTAPTQERMAI